MKKLAVSLLLLFTLSIAAESYAQYARRRTPVRRYFRWAVRVQNNATRRYRLVRVNATNEYNARRRALVLARNNWRPSHRGFRVVSVRRI